MPRERPRKNRSTDGPDPGEVTDLPQRRQRLARMIGRLLADTWLQRRRDAASIPNMDVDGAAAHQPTEASPAEP